MKIETLHQDNEVVALMEISQPSSKAECKTTSLTVSNVLALLLYDERVSICLSGNIENVYKLIGKCNRPRNAVDFKIASRISNNFQKLNEMCSMSDASTQSNIHKICFNLCN